MLCEHMSFVNMRNVRSAHRQTDSWVHKKRTCRGVGYGIRCRVWSRLAYVVGRGSGTVNVREIQAAGSLS